MPFPGNEWTDAELLFLNMLCEQHTRKNGTRAWGAIHEQFMEQFPESGRTKHSLHQMKYRLEEKMPKGERPQRRVYYRKKKSGDVAMSSDEKNGGEGGVKEDWGDETDFEGFSTEEEGTSAEAKDSEERETAGGDVLERDERMTAKSDVEDEGKSGDGRRRYGGKTWSPRLLPEREEMTPENRLEILERQLQLMQDNIAIIRRDLERRNSMALDG